MNIKPGCLCLLLRSDEFPAFTGRVVTAVRLVRRAVLESRDGALWVSQNVWVIDAPFLPAQQKLGWACESRYLIPLSDPDADETEDRVLEWTI